MKLLSSLLMVAFFSIHAQASTLEYKGKSTVPDKNGNTACRLSVHRDAGGKIKSLTVKGYSVRSYGVRWMEREVKNLKISAAKITARDAYKSEFEPNVKNSYDFQMAMSGTTPTSYKMKFKSTSYFGFIPESDVMTLNCENLNFADETATK